MGSLRRGFSWNLISQGVTAVTSLLVVPFVVHRLGLAAYGVFTLALSAAVLLQTVDGGLINAATRYFGIAAGTGDRRAVADHFLTISSLVLMLSCAIGGALFFAAPQATDLFRLGPLLKPEGVFAARVVAIVIPVGLVQSVLAAVLTSHGRFRTLAVANIASRVGYVAAVFALVGGHQGVQEIMRILLLQQCAALLLILPSALALMDLRHARMLPRGAVPEILRYSGQIQLAALTGVINLQVDAIIVGAVLPIRDVGLYGIGATVAAQLRTVPMNVSGPLVARLTQTLGREGKEATFREYARIQAQWVRAVAGFCAVALGISVFQIEVWLGHRFLAAGIVCVMLQAGNLINLLTLPLTVYLQAIGRPDLDVRYGVLGASLNLALTGAFIWVGMYGIVGGTAVGQIIGSVALLTLARSSVSREIPSFLSPMPWLAVIAGAATSAGSGALLTSLSPWHGASGLVFVSLGVVPGAAVFMATLVGPAGARKLAIRTLKQKSPRPIVQALLTADT